MASMAPCSGLPYTGPGLKPRLAVQHGAGAAMIEGVLSWWLQHLLAWVPASLRASDGPTDGTAATLQPDGGLLLERRQGGRSSPIGSLAAGHDAAALRRALGPRPGRISLLVPAAAMLRRPVELPIAAERTLGQVLRYEMDRLTPFGPDEVDWTWSVRGRDRARGRITLDLLLVPRTYAAPLRAAFAAIGHPLAALESPAGTVGLDRAASAGGRWRRRVLIAEGVACAALAVAAVAVPFVLQSLEARTVEARIQALRPAVDRADALRRRIAAGTAGADVLAAQAAATGEALPIVALVTAVLPDDTSLSELGWRNRQLTLSGQSAAAPRLIEALSRDPAIRNPVFAAPVTRDEAARLDRFSIRAELAP